VFFEQKSSELSVKHPFVSSPTLPPYRWRGSSKMSILGCVVVPKQHGEPRLYEDTNQRGPAHQTPPGESRSRFVRKGLEGREAVASRKKSHALHGIFFLA
jgi:hypothetical protein